MRRRGRTVAGFFTNLKFACLKCRRLYYTDASGGFEFGTEGTWAHSWRCDLGLAVLEGSSMVPATKVVVVRWLAAALILSDRRGWVADRIRRGEGDKIIIRPADAATNVRFLLPDKHNAVQCSLVVPASGGTCCDIRCKFRLKAGLRTGVCSILERYCG